MIKPLITVPVMAAIRFAFLSQATTLTISAIGGVRSIASPPRAVRGEPHPGCSRAIKAIITGATSDKPRPIFPEFDCGWFNSGGIGLSAFMPRSFHICRVASMALSADKG
jgi:hypothetical protein